MGRVGALGWGLWLCSVPLLCWHCLWVPQSSAHLGTPGTDPCRARLQKGLAAARSHLVQVLRSSLS